MEALRSDFIAHFWEFIKQGKYEDNQVEESERKYYRFIKPQTEGFPMQIELFSRKPDVIQGTDEMDLTPIPAEEELSNLSAILMDDDLALICLKAKAFLDLSKRNEAGEKVDSRDIRKHRNDVFRLAATLKEDDRIELPEGIKEDLTRFVDLLYETSPDIRSLMKSMGITAVNAEDLLDQIRKIFGLEN